VKKGQIVRVDKEKYLSSINVRRTRLLIFSFNYSDFNCDDEYYITCPMLMFQYLSVGHPPYYKGLDYIYEDRGEVKQTTK
jgi:hypothetical protein